MFVRLSYDLSPADPVWPGSPPVRIEPNSRIEDGGSSNSSVFSTLNHNGTHIDGPAHFVPGSPALSAFNIGEFVFENAALVDLPAGEDTPIDAEMLARHVEHPADIELLLARTGFSRHRRSDPQRYVLRGPYFLPSAADFLLGSCPRLRALGMDMLSAGSPGHKGEAHAFHRRILGDNASARHVFLIEDMKLDECPAEPGRVFVVPWFVAGLDSAPVTAFVEMPADVGNP